MLVCSSCAEIWDYTTIVDLEKKGKGDEEQKTGEFSRLGDVCTILCTTQVPYLAGQPVTLKL